MNKFKVGDKVELREDSKYCYRTGQLVGVGEVKEVRKSSYRYVVVWYGGSNGYREEDLILVGTEETKVHLEKQPTKSTGGKSSYYEVVLPQWLLDKQAKDGYIMLEDLAEVMYNNDFNFTNVMKAQKRMYELQQGGGKEGNDFQYDANKVKYYTDKQLEVHNRGK